MIADWLHFHASRFFLSSASHDNYLLALLIIYSYALSKTGDILRPDRMERDLQRKLKSQKRVTASSPGEVPTMADISQGPHDTEQHQQHQMPDLNPHDILQQQQSPAPLLDVPPQNQDTSCGVLEELKDGNSPEAGVETSLEIPDVAAAGNESAMLV